MTRAKLLIIAASGFAAGVLLNPLVGCSGSVAAIDELEDASVDATLIDFDGSGLDRAVTGDSATDASSDAASDAVTASDSSTVTDFLVEFLDTYCAKLSSCCFANPASPSFDFDKCRASFAPGGGQDGYQGSWKGLAGVDFDAGTTTLDLAKTTACLSALKTQACTSVTAAEHTAIIDACLGAIQGSVAPDGGCVNHGECAAGFCRDGVCAPLRGVGEPCGDWGGTAPEDAGFGPLAEKGVKVQPACTESGIGPTARHCNVFNFGTFEFLPQSQWTCEARTSGTLDPCFESSMCTSRLCDTSVPNCTASTTFFPAGGFLCTQYTKIADAGGGG